MNQWALAAAGGVSRSFLARLPGLARNLGPVASTSYRLAVRIANSLRAGHAVRSASELQCAPVILLCRPGAPLEDLVDSAFLDSLDWARKLVLICGSANSPHCQAALKGRGAAVAGLVELPDLPDHFVVEGDRDAVRFAKAITKPLRASIIEVPRERMLLFESALTFSGSLFTPLMEITVECLRQSGLEQPLAAKLAELLFQQSLRAFKHAGRKSWTGPIALADYRALEDQETALHAVKPIMAAYFRDSAKHGLGLYQSFPELTRYNKRRWHEFRLRYQQTSS